MKPRHILTRIPPTQKVLLSFVLLILTGTIFLWLPFSVTKPISVTDALFTSTSAVCVTGLVVLDTPVDFTMAGQIVILLLIQFGGLGIMTFSVALMALLGGDYSLKWRNTLEGIYSDTRSLPIASILKRIVVYTLAIESTAALALFFCFLRRHDALTSLWYAIFHAISAFCNAGFSTYSDNLVSYRGDPAVNLIITTAIILGGLGFLVMTELLNARFRRRRRGLHQFSLHTRIALTMTLILTLGGTAVILLLEWGNNFASFTVGEKILSAYFQSVTCRTAGFNSVDIGALRQSTLLVMTALMFIGGSPGSIAGGIKTTTLAAVSGMLWAKFNGRSQVIFWGKALAPDIMDKATTLLTLAGIFVLGASFLMLALPTGDEQHSFLATLFEVVSGFGTVGLSTGITPKLSNTGKIILVIVMYVGRLGPLTLITALTEKNRESVFNYAEEQIMIG